MECLLKNLGQIQCAKYPGVGLQNQFFLTHLLRNQIRPSTYTYFSRQSRFPCPNQKYIEQRNNMTFDRRLVNIADPVLVFRGLYCPSSENLMSKALHEITANSQGWFNPFFLSLVP